MQKYGTFFTIRCSLLCYVTLREGARAVPCVA